MIIFFISVKISVDYNFVTVKSFGFLKLQSFANDAKICCFVEHFLLTIYFSGFIKNPFLTCLSIILFSYMISLIFYVLMLQWLMIISSFHFIWSSFGGRWSFILLFIFIVHIFIKIITFIQISIWELDCFWQCPLIITDIFRITW